MGTIVKSPLFLDEEDINSGIYGLYFRNMIEIWADIEHEWIRP